MRFWKATAAAMVGMIVLSLIYLLIWRCSLTDAGLLRLVNITDYLQMAEDGTIIALDADGDFSLEEEKEQFFSAIQEGSEQLHHELQILVVEVWETSQYQNEIVEYQGSFYMQSNILVKEVISGDEALQDVILDVYIPGGMRLNENGELINTGNNGKNLMLPGEQYLILCEEVEAQEKLQALPSYRLLDTLFNQLNITSDMTGLVDEEGHTVNYRNIEFFVQSAELLDALLEAKHELLAEYGIEMGTRF